MPPSAPACRDVAPRVQPHDAIRAARPARRDGRSRASSARRAGARPPRRRPPTLSGSRSAVGSSRITSGASRRKARASADPPALPGRERAPAVAETCRSPPAARRRSCPRRRAPRRPRTASIAAPGVAEADVVGDARPQQRGLLRHPGDVPPPRGGVAGREVDAADRHPPRDRPQEPEQQRAIVLLPAPLAPDERHGLARLQRQVEPVEDRAGPATGTRTTRRSSRTGAPAGLGGSRRRRAPRPPGGVEQLAACGPPRRARRRTRGTRRPAGAAAGTAPARARAPSGPA